MKPWSVFLGVSQTLMNCNFDSYREWKFWNLFVDGLGEMRKEKEESFFHTSLYNVMVLN